ncbi:VOC family protein, partial [Kocuria sp. M1R5S2]|uniref:VOC family protein n=1 Tax=Kocuria rhizosphaerae TaxID=3376285 RepID=UPI0037AC737A
EPWPNGTPCWVDLMATDPDRSQEFYRAVLGWEFEDPGAGPEYGGYRWALVDGRPVAGLSPTVPDLEGLPHLWRVYLATRDVPECVQRITEAGGTLLAGPTEVGRFGTMALCADPTGATFGLWQAGAHPGFRVVDVPGAVVWCDLVTPDHEAARDFYADVFGYSYHDSGADGAPYAMFTVPHEEGPAGGIGGTDPAAENAPAVWSVCFQVDDVDDVVRRVRGAGGSVMEDPIEFPYGRLAVVAGPDRESFAVMTPGEPEPATG